MSRYVVAFLICVVASFAAQSTYSQECPIVSVTCADISTESTAIFTANVVDNPRNEPKFKWHVTGGRIKHGQGTDSIEVEVDKAGHLVTAAIEVTSFPIQCNNKASCSTGIRYPTHWWTPIDDPKKPEWEILPQEAGPGEVILSKRHELGLLSNFAATPFVFHGKRYASLEGFWQAMLYPESPKDPRAKFPGLEWKHTRTQVAQMTAFEAKHAGDLAEANMRQMKIGWVSFEGRRFAYRPKRAGSHYRLIVAATRAKVMQNPEVKKVLLSTGDLVLKPDHHQEPNAPEAWRYFEILMRIRGQLQHR